MWFGRHRHYLSCLTDSKASTADSTNVSKPITTQNGSSSLSLLGAYSDSDSNDSEWKEDFWAGFWFEWQTQFLNYTKVTWTSKSCVYQFVGLSYENLPIKTESKSMYWWPVINSNCIVCCLNPVKLIIPLLIL